MACTSETMSIQKLATSLSYLRKSEACQDITSKVKGINVSSNVCQKEGITMPGKTPVTCPPWEFCT